MKDMAIAEFFLKTQTHKRIVWEKRIILDF